MLNTQSARSARSRVSAARPPEGAHTLSEGPARSAKGAPSSADGDATPPALAGLAALGDAVAVIVRKNGSLRWATEAWHALVTGVECGASRAELEKRLPGLKAALAESAAADRTRRVRLGQAQQFDAELAPLDDDHMLLRLIDWRDQSRVLQRQLDDREQLLFTSRVFSVGEMATTLAHELNQPIGAAANLLRGLRSRLSRRAHAEPVPGRSQAGSPPLGGGARWRAPGGPLTTEEAQALERALEQVMFAARVIGRIREFTHSHQPRHTRLDLAALVRASASLLDWDLRRSAAQLVLELPEHAVTVRGDEVMLQQVVVNLMRNALDAMRSDPPEQPELALRLVLRANEAELQVCDNGCGLGDEAAAKLFVPFASSKPNGMGIGLSICRSFVELHQGRLWFTRNAQRGATFHLSLPLPPPAADSAKATAVPSTEISQ
jgi:two-component system, LuxR family, sensor kinase FixL